MPKHENTPDQQKRHAVLGEASKTGVISQAEALVLAQSDMSPEALMLEIAKRKRALEAQQAKEAKKKRARRGAKILKSVKKVKGKKSPKTKDTKKTKKGVLAKVKKVVGKLTKSVKKSDKSVKKDKPKKAGGKSALPSVAKSQKQASKSESKLTSKAKKSNICNAYKASLKKAHQKKAGGPHAGAKG